MIQSMTGYGQATQAFGDYRMRVELKSVNHRYLELNIRLPREWMRLEDVFRQSLRTMLHRGKVDAFVAIEREADKEINYALDWPVANAYFNAAEQLRAKFDLINSLTVQDLMQIPNLFKLNDVVDESDFNMLQEQLLVCTEAALIEILDMRKVEGSHLQQDLILRLGLLKSLHHAMRNYAPNVSEIYRKKLLARVQEFLASTSIDEQRVLQEVVLFADRSNIDEELIRLDSHFQQFGRLLNAVEPAGRKLDFLLQEMNREVNTIGSKANDGEIQNKIIEMKAELEKMREQVQNIQ